MPLRTEAHLREHQRGQLDFFRENARALSLLMYGSGKTQPTILRLLDLVPPYRALIVTTHAGLEKWRDELRTWGHPAWRIEIIHSDRQRVRWDAFRRPHNVAVMNLEGVLVLGSALLNRYPVIVFDEIHRLRDAAGKMSRAYAVLSESAQFVYGLTGDPIVNHPVDLYGVVRAVNRQIWPQPFDDWRDQHFFYGPAEKGAYPTWNLKDGAKEALEDALHAISYYRPESELDVTYPEARPMPPKTFDLGPFALSKYREADEQLALDLEGMGLTSLEHLYPRLHKLRQLARGWVYAPGKRPIVIETGPVKKAVEEYLEEAAPSGRVVMWCVYVPEVGFLSSVCRKMGLLPGVLGERSSPKQIHALLRAFNGGRYDVLIAHPARIGETIDLVAEHSFRFSASWSPMEKRQSEGRLRRANSRAPWVTYTDLMARNAGIDDWIYGNLSDSAKVARAILERKELPWRTTAKSA